MPMLNAATSIRVSFSTLFRSTARMPLDSTNPATTINAIVMASGRLMASKLAIWTMRPRPVSCSCRLRNNEEEADDRNQGCQILAPVALLEEVGLGVEREFASGLPDSGQNKERDNVSQRKVCNN